MRIVARTHKSASRTALNRVADSCTPIKADRQAIEAIKKKDEVLRFETQQAIDKINKRIDTLLARRNELQTEGDGLLGAEETAKSLNLARIQETDDELTELGKNKSKITLAYENAQAELKKDIRNIKLVRKAKEAGLYPKLLPHQTTLAKRRKKDGLPLLVTFTPNSARVRFKENGPISDGMPKCVVPFYGDVSETLQKLSFQKAFGSNVRRIALFVAAVILSIAAGAYMLLSASASVACILLAIGGVVLYSMGILLIRTLIKLEEDLDNRGLVRLIGGIIGVLSVIEGIVLLCWCPFGAPFGLPATTILVFGAVLTFFFAIADSSSDECMSLGIIGVLLSIASGTLMVFIAIASSSITGILLLIGGIVVCAASIFIATHIATVLVKMVVKKQSIYNFKSSFEAILPASKGKFPEWVKGYIENAKLIFDDVFLLAEVYDNPTFERVASQNELSFSSLQSSLFSLMGGIRKNGLKLVAATDTMVKQVKQLLPDFDPLIIGYLEETEQFYLLEEFDATNAEIWVRDLCKTVSGCTTPSIPNKPEA